LSVMDLRARARRAVTKRGNGLLRAAARGLSASGIPMDPSTGRVIVESPIFGKVKSQIKGSAMERRLNDYLRSYARWIDGPANRTDAAMTGTKVFEQGIPKENRFVNLAEVRPGVRENQFMREVDGRLAFKTQKEIDAEFESRRQTFQSMRRGALPVKVDSEWGQHRAPDGSVRVGGAVLPERFMQQPNVGPYLKAVEAEMRDAQSAGRSVRIVYHKIGSQTPRGYRVKNLGNLRADVLEVIPFWRQITKADNVLVHVLDADQFRRNAIKEINAGKLPEFGNDMVQVERDLKQYLENHRQSLPGENGIGTGKRDALNRLLGIGTIENKGKNPLAAAIGTPRAKSAVKTLRLDRVEMARPGNEGMAFDYHRANSNMMPDGEWRADPQVDGGNEKPEKPRQTRIVAQSNQPQNEVDLESGTEARNLMQQMPAAAYPVRRLERSNNLKTYWDWFKENLEGKSLTTPIGKVSVFKRGHFMKLIAGGRDKGFIPGAENWGDIVRKIEAGEVRLDDPDTAPKGFEEYRARNMTLIPDVVENPVAILRSKDDPTALIFLKKYKRDQESVWQGVFVDLGDEAAIKSWRPRKTITEEWLKGHTLVWRNKVGG
ncbi:MAG: hypothetical protein WCS65_17555, partial [Verrucomicrobiae bacterium]